MKAFNFDLDTSHISGVDSMLIFAYTFTKTSNFTSLSVKDFFWKQDVSSTQNHLLITRSIATKIENFHAFQADYLFQ